MELPGLFAGSAAQAIAFWAELVKGGCSGLK